MLTLKFSDRVIYLYKKVANLLIFLALQNDHAMFKEVHQYFISSKRCVQIILIFD